MNLEQTILGWTRGARRELAGIEERLPLVVERARTGTARNAVEGWDSRVLTPALASPIEARVMIGALVPLVERAVDEENARLPSEGGISFALLGLLDLGNALECVGCPLQPDSGSTMRSWLGRIEALRDDDRAHYYWTTGFAALALNDRVTYARFAGYRGGALQEPVRTVAGPPRGPFPFEPGQTFQFNLQGLLAYLAGAVENRATEADVVPAWEDLLRSYPMLRDTKSIDQGTLLWIARTVFHRIGGYPLGEVAQRLHDSAWRLAGMEP